MASLTLAEAAYLTENPLVAGIVREYITPDAFAAVIPQIQLKGGRARFFNREDADPKTTVGALNIAGTPVASQTTVTQMTHILGRLGGDAEVDNFEQVTMSNVNNQMEIAIQNKARGLGRLYRQYVVSGSGTFPQFSGINTLVDSSNMWKAFGSTTAGGAITFALLDELMDLVTQDGDMFFFTMDKTCLRKMRALYRALGGIEPEKVEVGWIDPVTGNPTGRMIMAYSGYPIFRNDNIAAECTYGKTGKYRVSFGIMDTENGLAGIMPEDGNAGVRVIPIGQKDAVPNEAVRLEMYTGLTLSSSKALAQGVNILN